MGNAAPQLVPSQIYMLKSSHQLDSVGVFKSSWSLLLWRTTLLLCCLAVHVPDLFSMLKTQVAVALCMPQESARAIRYSKMEGTFRSSTLFHLQAGNLTNAHKIYNYFTSSYPHHDISTFCYWQIFWHSI